MNSLLKASQDDGLIVLSVHDHDAELARDVIEGMQANPKTLPSKYFYDARGGELFERITQLPEYYLTRAEVALIGRFGRDILVESRAQEVLEVGAGSAAKICLLLDAASSHEVEVYGALDVNGTALHQAGEALQVHHPEVGVAGFIGDFITDLAKVPPPAGRRLLVFFGSTIGNLDAAARARFFDDVAGLLGREDYFLLGLDLVKARERLRQAYDDSQGITAEFTRNILEVINRELRADFPTEEFAHVPRWNEREQRMEAWLRAGRAMSVHIDALDLQVSLDANEEILTEVSCKFTAEGISRELATAALRIHRWYTDETSSFALALIKR